MEKSVAHRSEDVMIPTLLGILCPVWVSSVNSADKLEEVQWKVITMVSGLDSDIQGGGQLSFSTLKREGKGKNLSAVSSCLM